MCGIAGFVDKGISDPAQLLKRMTDAIAYRGPDAEGAWIDRATGVALGHRRLSIVDLSPTGAQPMISSSERYVITFNGEVYNFGEIRIELEELGHHFKGSSDTEVMLAAFEEWGLFEAVPKFNGMFAFALWDRETKSLFLVRDRVGVKPLYYGINNNVLVFGSELKSVLPHPVFESSIDNNSVLAFLTFGYIPAPNSIFKGIKKLKPGYILKTDFSSGSLTLNEIQYWSANIAALAPKTSSEDIATSISSLHRLLTDSIKLRMISDVPLGAFLSGGIDSSTVVAIMQELHTKPVKTFAIGFVEDAFNEAHHAKAVAEHLGTDHTELIVTPAEARSIIPLLPRMYDEPFGDMSQIPTYIVSGLARQKVTVSLSGDGGDELFLGYSRYHAAHTVWKFLHRLSGSSRKKLAQLITNTQSKKLDSMFSYIAPLMPSRLRISNIGDKLHRFAQRMDADSLPMLYHNMVRHWPSKVMRDSALKINNEIDASLATQLDYFTYMSLTDLNSYLPDDILVKLDRASMAHSLEAREPLLDYRIIEFALKLPINAKVRGGSAKWILRKVLEKYVPSKLTERPKMGFGVPIDNWLRGPLRAWGEELLLSDNIKRQGFFDEKFVRHIWTEHVDGRTNHMYLLWDILMFQAWLQETGTFTFSSE